MSDSLGPDSGPTLPQAHNPKLPGVWAAPIALAVITAGLSVLNPGLLIFVPLAFMLMALQPRKPWLMIVAVVLLVSTFTGKTGGVLWWYGRGWALILSAWFILAIVLLRTTSVLARSLAALSGSVLTVTLVFVGNRGGWYALDSAVSGQLRTAAADVVSFWGTRMQGKQWAEGLTSSIYRFTEFQTTAFPALLAIASVSGLALAWWLWRRLAVQERRPLGLLRDFRFTDELIWLVVVGAVLIVAPLDGAVADRAGTNLLTFMAALYAVRGLAVMIALFGTPGLLGMLFGALVFLMLYPIVMATTLMVGLTDTWLDLRARRLTRQDNEKH